MLSETKNGSNKNKSQIGSLLAMKECGDVKV
jgi:hypothetical protein